MSQKKLFWGRKKCKGQGGGGKKKKVLENDPPPFFPVQLMVHIYMYSSKITRCPTCGELTRDHQCCKPKRDYSRSVSISDRCPLYGGQRWKDLRRSLMAKHPMCQRCNDRLSVDVHHMDGHDGTPATFYAGPFMCLCRRCHANVEY